MKKHASFIKLLLLLLAINYFTNSFAQISAGGTPPSFYFEPENEVLSSTENLPITFNIAALRAEDAERELDNLPPRVGTIIPVNFTTENSGEWTLLPDGQDIWRLCIIAEDAIALMLYYDKFEIPAGGKLFIYNNDRSKVLGAYTEENNPQRVEYATEFVSGDIITLEYVAPQYTDYESPIIISGVLYGYNSLYVEKSLDGEQSRIVIGDSEPCEVNINCPEGANWQDQKRGVIRLLTKIGVNSYFCSASVINNTAEDFDPLVLSAYHCFQGATPAEMNQLKCAFNYERVACTGNTMASSKTMTGAAILVNIPISGSSDGTLLRLNEHIPLSYNAYYNGWDRRNIAPTSGVGIHHPAGDVKKISTFTTTLTQSYCLSGMPVGASWQVKWAATQTNHGVTEGGSSGSPIFNQNKHIVGTLSGGSSECTAPNGTDCYGKLWYHWDQHATQKMKTYLDPINSGVESLDGIYEPTIPCESAKNLTVTYTEDCKSALLQWEAPEEANVFYRVYRDNSLIKNNHQETSYTDNNFVKTNAHTWSVVTVCTTTGIESEPLSFFKEACIRPYTVSVSASPEAGGTVSGGGDYNPNATATVKATPNENYKFVNWTKENIEVSPNASYTFLVTEDVALVANFIDDNGINENGGIKNFTFYPNPAGDQLNVVRTNADKAQIIIYNNIGLIMQSFEMNEIETSINISTLSSGIYFIRLIDSQTSSTQSFVKK